MRKRKYHVAVILINYNSSQFTLDCVQSIFDKTSTTIRFQVVIVDNNSRKEEYEKLQPLVGRPDVQIFRSRLNTGFSGANMMGVQLADADYYYFLNNDCVLLSDCLFILYSFLEKNQSAANCSGEMFTAAMEYEYNFRYFPTLALKLVGSGILRQIWPERFPDKYARLSVPTKVDLVNGSSMFIRATAFEDIGGFDTNHFLYLEEEDIALRLARTEHSTYLVPEAKYQHFISKSTQHDNKINLPFLKEFYISFFYYFRKNYGPAYAGTMRVIYFFKVFRKFYKNVDYARLAFFIAAGAPMKQSLRFRQKVNSD